MLPNKVDTFKQFPYARYRQGFRTRDRLFEPLVTEAEGSTTLISISKYVMDWTCRSDGDKKHIQN
jgi:hypothetical protein